MRGGDDNKDAVPKVQVQSRVFRFELLSPIGTTFVSINLVSFSVRGVSFGDLDGHIRVLSGLLDKIYDP